MNHKMGVMKCRPTVRFAPGVCRFSTPNTSTSSRSVLAVKVVGQ